MKIRKRDMLDKRRTVWEKLFFDGMFLILLLWSIIMITMLVWTVMSSLKTNLQYVNDSIALPTELHFENFIIAMDKLNVNGVNFWGMLYNSAWQTILPSLISTTMVCITGYVFAQYDFKGKDLLMAVVLFTMIIPIYGNFAANYKLTYDLGLNDSYLYLIKSFGGLGGNMLLTYGFFKGVPKVLREAVYVDGGSDFTAFFKVYFPLGRNIFIALFLLSFIGTWNDYETPLLYFNKMPNLALGLYNFQQEIVYEANNPAYFAGTLIVMLPVVIMFILFSDKIMGQLSVGAVKG